MANLRIATMNDVPRFKAQGVTEFWYGTQAEFDAIASPATDTVYIITDDATGTEKNIVRALLISATRAELIAGKTLIPARQAQQLQILSVQAVVTGAFNGGAGTSVILQDSNSSPVVVLTALKAALTDGARISTKALAISNVTEGAGMTGPLTEGKALVIKPDAAWDAGTSIAFKIEYMYV